MKQKQHEKELHTIERELNKQLKLEEQVRKSQEKQAMMAEKQKLKDLTSVEPTQVETRETRNGRTIALPTRFKE
jgi:hypothetical protein